ncbi:MAG: hypothetical protein JRE23_16340 [Deltaproteobacteria bacterium]|nr:hypothetical protein [Deltaproteobacteria bacterium]
MKKIKSRRELWNAALYLRVPADRQVFGREGKRIRRILRAAIGLEKDSTIFYLGMKELVPENLGKNRIDKIIKEVMFI